MDEPRGSPYGVNPRISLHFNCRENTLIEEKNSKRKKESCIFSINTNLVNYLSTQLVNKHNLLPKKKGKQTQSINKSKTSICAN